RRCARRARGVPVRAPRLRRSGRGHRDPRWFPARRPAASRSMKRKEIVWSELDARALDAHKRAIVGKTWRERMRQEHLAVGAFAMVAQELAEEGCEPVVLSLITRAASDEVRHTEVCRRVAVALLGDEAVPARLRGLPSIPRHEGATARE